jgi:(p)ppGpp synthase/HD superfamily hydrolase
MCNYIATQAHYGQFRRDGVTPYIAHPEAVAGRLTTFDEKAVAWLHDVIEDTSIQGFQLLNKGVPARIVGAVVDITKYPGESITIYYERVKKNPLAKAVKIEDMLHNLSDTPTKKQIIKYAKGLLFLLED